MTNAAYDWTSEPKNLGEIHRLAPAQPPPAGRFLRLFDYFFRYQQWRERWH
jgi:hypothetical protein